MKRGATHSIETKATLAKKARGRMSDAERARITKQILAIRREITDLKLKEEQLDLDGDPRPPGNWISVKAAADASGYSISGIHRKVRMGALRKWKRGGRVVVDGDQLVSKKTKKHRVHF